MKFLFAALLFFYSIHSQSLQKQYENIGEVIIENFINAPFPHSKRIDGHKYKDKIYPQQIHYNDSSAAIFIPKKFKQAKQTDFVFYFHGWWNNIDTAIVMHKLIEQFNESNKNAILVIPEVPKNAPDSFGGKLEDSLGFKKFVDELILKLFTKNKIKTKNIGNIILAGHSGAYRVISFILHWGGFSKNIKEVFLFDGLYANREKFLNWLDKYDGKLINIYTENGGTKEETALLKDEIICASLSITIKSEDETTFDIIKKNKIIFVNSSLGHNDVIHIKKNFMKYLQASCLKDF